MTDRSEPVEYTCPLIDEVLEMVQAIHGIGDAEDAGSTSLDDSKQMIDDVFSFNLGKFNDLMEEIRSANDALRTWGNGLVEDLEEADKFETELEEVKEERAQLEGELQDAQNEIGDLESQVASLENQVSDLENGL